MSDEWERGASDEPVDEPIPTPIDGLGEDDLAAVEALPDTAPFPDEETPITEELPEEPSDAIEADAPYQWNPTDDVVWPVTYGDPLPGERADMIESADDTGEFVMVGEELGDTFAPALMVDLSAGTPEERAPVELRQPPSLFGWLRNLFAGTSLEEQQQRLIRLNHAISEYPDLPANYVLRGELYLNFGERAQAVSDFHMALELAETQLEIRDWGFVAQTMRDRALVGLRKAGWQEHRKRKMKPVE